MSGSSTMQKSKPTHVRYLILLMLFLVTTINYADRATIAIAGSSIQKDLGITPVTLGYIFSAFGWAYVAGQIPGGWLLDRFGSKKVYAMSIFTWSLFTLLQGYVGEFGISTAIVALFMLRFLVGLAEAPSFPGNARIVAAWFPTAERGTASAIFNSAQYFATVLFAPLMGWIVYTYGWQHVFVVMGAVGILFSMIWMKVIYGPRNHPMINEAEFEHISNNGALVDLDQDKGKGKEKAASSGPKWDYIRQLLTNRMMLGIYLSQYCINGITYFFLTWFP
ncbi:Major facilitator superfamily transporter phthalate permease, partial [Pseudomonas syringae pv. broussonetiae]